MGLSVRPAEKRSLLHASAVLEYVGVKSPDDIDELVEFFWQGQSKDDSVLQVDVSDTLPLLREFMRQRKRTEMSEKSASPPTPSTRPSTPASSCESPHHVAEEDDDA